MKVENFNGQYGRAEQIVYYDPSANKIEVVHEFNLNPGEDVILAKIVRLKVDDGKQKSKKKHPNPKVKYKTFFYYFFTDGGVKAKHAKKFPLNGTSFPLAGDQDNIEPIVFETYGEYLATINPVL